jgi:hypothetical protein
MSTDGLHRHHQRLKISVSLKSGSAAKTGIGIGRHLTRQKMTVPQGNTEWKTQQRGASYTPGDIKQGNLFFFVLNKRHSSKKDAASFST